MNGSNTERPPKPEDSASETYATLHAALERTRARCNRISQMCLDVIEDDEQRRPSEPPPSAEPISASGA